MCRGKILYIYRSIVVLFSRRSGWVASILLTTKTFVHTPALPVLRKKISSIPPKFWTNRADSTNRSPHHNLNFSGQYTSAPPRIGKPIQIRCPFPNVWSFQGMFFSSFFLAIEGGFHTTTRYVIIFGHRTSLDRCSVKMHQQQSTSTSSCLHIGIFCLFANVTKNKNEKTNQHARQTKIQKIQKIQKKIQRIQKYKNTKNTKKNTKNTKIQKYEKYKKYKKLQKTSWYKKYKKY